MPATSLIDNVMAVLGLPLAFAVTGFGIGLLIERVLRVRVPNALLIPLGACGSILVSLGVYRTGLGDGPAVAITLALTIAGLVLARGELPARLKIGWPGLAGLGAYVLFLAPELLSGHWTWSGYNFVNDSAVQMVLTSYMKTHGTKSVGLAPPQSTAAATVAQYLFGSYPLGTHAQLATLSGLLHTPPGVVYQGYIAALAGMTAMALAAISEGFLGARRAAVAGFIAVAAALTFQYALQGNIKELGALATTMTAVAVAHHVVRRGIDLRGAVMAAIPLAAILDVYYAAGLPFVAAVAVVALATAFLLRRRWPDARMLGALALSVVATAAFALPAVTSLRSSYDVLSQGFGAETAPATQPASTPTTASTPAKTTAGAPAKTTASTPVKPPPNLGQLARPLPVSEVSGVWLGGDYRYAILAEPARFLTAAAAVLIFALALLGAARAVRAGEPGPAMLLATMALLLVVVLPRVSAYAGGKALAISSPAIVLAAFAGASTVRPARRLRRMRFAVPWVLGGVAAACIGAGVIASDAVAFNFDYVAPTPRMVAIGQVTRHLPAGGLVLWNEFEEYAKVFGQPARINDPSEPYTPRQLALGQHLDLDQEALSFVESFPVIVLRRSPAASRPPANYRLLYSNAYYEAWERRPAPRVLRHLPAQGLYSASAPVGCPQLRALVARAPAGSKLVLAQPRFVTSFIPADVGHPFSWPVDGVHPDALTIVRGGFVTGKLAVPAAGRYELWIQGNLPGAVHVLLDARAVGTAQGVNTQSEWYPVAQVKLGPGTHYVVANHNVNYLQPGNGGSAWIGPVALSAQQPEHLETVPLARWHSLCGRTADWVELVGS